MKHIIFKRLSSGLVVDGYPGYAFIGASAGLARNLVLRLLFQTIAHLMILNGCGHRQEKNSDKYEKQPFIPSQSYPTCLIREHVI